jgi:hypothetical protein
MKEEKSPGSYGNLKDQSTKRKDPHLDVGESGLSTITIVVDDKVISLLKMAGLSIDQLFILQCLHLKSNSLLAVFFSGFQEAALPALQTLVQKEYVLKINNIRDEYIIDQKGADLLRSLLNTSGKSSSNTIDTDINSKSFDTKFEEWWAAYPRTATWVAENGTMFISGRVLHTGTKKENRKLYLAILDEGIYSHEQLIASLRCEIAAKKKQSVLKGENALNYMKGSHSYLMCRYFENFMALIDSGILSEERTSSWEAG